MCASALAGEHRGWWISATLSNGYFFSSGVKRSAAELMQ